MAPKTTEYGAINKGDEEQPFLISSSSLEDMQTPKQNKKGKVSIFIGILVAVLLACGYYYHKASPTPSGSSSVSSARLLGSPVEDLGLQEVRRAKDASPNTRIWGEKWSKGPLPTNSWYLNLVSHRADQPDESTRVYTVPYIVDTVTDKPMSAAVRVHWPVVQPSSTNIQMVSDFHNALALGTTDNDVSSQYTVDQNIDLSLLGISLQWNSSDASKTMQTSLVRGMPYTSMTYSAGLLPSIFSYNAPTKKLLVDGSEEVDCGVLKDGVIDGSSVSVEKEIQMHFLNSDFTWAAFFSKPVEIQCGVEGGDQNVAKFLLKVKSVEDKQSPLVVRVALIDECTTGQADIKAHCAVDKTVDKKSYLGILRKHVGIVPTSPVVDISYPKEDDEKSMASLSFDFVPEKIGDTDDTDELIMYALPHHQKALQDQSGVTDTCFTTFHGATCLVKGSKWIFKKDIGYSESFTAPRPPSADHMSLIADALSADITYSLSSNMLRGAADTYFSGKLLARLGRTLMIAHELKTLAKEDTSILKQWYSDANDFSIDQSMQKAVSLESKLPSDNEFQKAVDQLKKGVQVWLDKPEAEYLYDSNWGGFVNCGCNYEGKGGNGVCNNTFPDCPALSDVNIDFGNGYYNDHHYHYGYHVYAAAVVAHFDHAWAVEYFPKVLLYIRDFANPWGDDKFFTQWRHKDWFLGSSWASGIISAENSPHGRNEESSSEAIAAYESVALFGKVLVDAMKDSGDTHGLKTARRIRDAGRLLTITEIEATNRYWHVWSSEKHPKTYSEEYDEPVVGMMYETMASFQTWFAPSAETSALVSYGIQLMPFTAVAELRDDPEWTSILYPKYEESCKATEKFCVENGWSILQACLNAEAGHQEEALEQAMAIPKEVFDTQGGMGNSLSNTLWFISTRKGSKQ